MSKKILIILTLVSSYNIFSFDSEPDENETEYFNETEEEATEENRSINITEDPNFISFDDAQVLALEIAQYQYATLFQAINDEFIHKIIELINESTIIDINENVFINKKQLIDEINKWATQREKSLPPISITVDDTQVQTPCKHTFHRGCIQTALRLNPHCPYCKQTTDDKSLIISNNHTESHCPICLREFHK
jgi:hypothetical protein